MRFDGRILVIGCGSVSQCVLPLLFKLVEIPAERVTILDFVDNRAKIKDALDRGANYKFGRITKANLAAELSEMVSAGDIVIDLAWNIGCEDIVGWCHDNRVLYINTSVEEWDPYGEEDRKDPRPYTLYHRQMKLKKMIANWGGNKGTTAIVDHGANPGLVSHFTKVALIDIARKIIETKPNDARVSLLADALAAKNFAHLAHLTDVKTIHISERDTQIANVPKEVNEFVNTWSIEGFFEEGVAPAELGWGTHERYIPEGMHFHEEGPQNQTCLTTIGVKTWVRSFVPSGEITGMVIRHGEAFGISDRLTVWQNGEAIYRPTVHYAYCPCDAAIASLQELEMRQFDLQANQRIMSDEIVKGRDELGVLLMGHDFNSWWTGSLLDIQECRRLVPHQNATTLQVAISVLAAAMWAMKHPEEGFCLPDDVDHEEVMAVCYPYLGPFLSDPFDWTPLKNLNPKYTHFNQSLPREEDVWQFTTFLLDPREAQRAKTLEQAKPKSKGVLADIATQTGKVRV